MSFDPQRGSHTSSYYYAHCEHFVISSAGTTTVTGTALTIHFLELFTHMVMDNSSGEKNRWRPCAVVPKRLAGGVYVRRSAEEEMRYVSNVAGVIDIVGVVTGGSLTGVQTARTMA